MTTARLVSLGEVVKSADPGFACGEHLPTGVLQLRMNNVTVAGTLDWSAMRRVPSNDIKSRKYGLAPGDVVFNHTNSPELVGKTALFTGFKEAVVYSNHFLRLRVDEAHLYPRYLALWLNFQWKRRVFLRLCTQWVNQATVRRDDLLDLEIALPAVAEQKRIAAMFERADRLRRLQRYGAEASDSILTAAFDRMFGDPIRNEKGFTRQRLEDLITPTRPITYGILKPGPNIPNGVPYVRVLDIQNGSVVVHGVRRTSPEIDQAYKRSRLKPGDLLLSIRGHVGRMGIVPPALSGANITQDTARLAPVDAIDPKYLMGCLGSNPMQHLMSTLTRGAAVQGINLGDVKELPIPVPPLPLQRKFAGIVGHHTRLTAIHREALRQAEHLFQTLLDRAFSRGP